MSTVTHPVVPMTALDENLTQRRRRILAAGVTTADAEVWQAVSACHRWLYERLEGPSTPWLVTYVPTAQSVTAASLPACRRITANEPIILAHLRRLAVDVINRDGRSPDMLVRYVGGLPRRVEEDPQLVAARLAHARRHLAVLDGLLVAATPDGVCACGGWLTNGQAVHADVCADCVELDELGRLRCPRLHEHQLCPVADPVPCDHGCLTAAGPLGDCWRGRDFCCGRCCTDA